MTSSTGTSPRPLRGTRPANRRELILDAATRLFAEQGYEHVAIGDIAAAVEVGPSALYRHFRGKEQILAEVITVAADSFATAVSAPSPPATTVGVAASFALDHRSLGVLWQREARHLPPESYADVQGRIRSARGVFARAVCAGRSHDASATGALSVLLSPSFHHVDLPRPDYDALLADLAERALAVRVPAATPRPAAAPGLTRSSTREGLVSAAVELFAARTYASTSMEDIAGSVGKTASSLYNHLPSKHELLLTALSRSNGYLQITLDETLALSSDAPSALSDLVGTYARFALRHPALIDVLVTEVRNLPEALAASVRHDQRAYVDEWVHLLMTIHPQLDSPRARVTVQATLMLLNDLARSPRSRERADAEQVMASLARAVLEI